MNHYPMNKTKNKRHLIKIRWRIESTSLLPNEYKKEEAHVSIRLNYFQFCKSSTSVGLVLGTRIALDWFGSGDNWHSGENGRGLPSFSDRKSVIAVLVCVCWCKKTQHFTCCVTIKSYVCKLYYISTHCIFV